MSSERYLEDFAVGDIIPHRRGHTVTEADNEILSLLTMNTAQTHFHRASLADYFDGSFQDLPLSAPVALAIAVGLTSEDMSEHALAEVSCTAIRTPAPIVAGDDLTATSEVLAIGDGPDAGCGVLTYRITVRSAGRDVLSAERTVLLKRRAVHALRDAQRRDATSAAFHRLWGDPVPE